MFKRILVPLDGSPLAETVLPHAEALAQALDAEVILLRVTVNPAAEYSFSDPGLASDLIQQIEQESKTYIKAMCARLEKNGVRATYLIRQGIVADTILQVSEAMQADLIAMSTHGRSGIPRWLLGSVADRVLRISPMPVMLFHPKADAA